MNERMNRNEFDLFLNSLDRSELSNEEMLLLSSLGGESASGDATNPSCTYNNCHGGNCVKGCG
ncbi:hypothetical protein [Dysgonomonas capnocytophagoides]|uniref:hypothetical protein n=1 Tax=Dysgonomonas capnocytophagoides TaxID=45254 RepID=UPI0033417FA4